MNFGLLRFSDHRDFFGIFGRSPGFRIFGKSPGFRIFLVSGFFLISGFLSPGFFTFGISRGFLLSPGSVFFFVGWDIPTKSQFWFISNKLSLRVTRSHYDLPPNRASMGDFHLPYFIFHNFRTCCCRPLLAVFWLHNEILRVYDVSCGSFD